MDTREARPAGERWCECVATHSPAQLPNEAEGHHVWPLGHDGPDIASNMRWLCPTTHTKVHNLWRAYAKAGGPPPWDVLKRYSAYVRDIVSSGWAQVVAAQKVEAVRLIVRREETRHG